MIRLKMKNYNTINRKVAKISALSLENIDVNEYFTGAYR